MRTAFVHTLTDLMRQDKRVFVLTGDLGFSVFEKLRDEFPRRFINAGVAEQNMIGVAAGLALCDKIVFVYSIIPFAVMRCLEQIRNDVCMQELNVKIVGMGAGLHYGPSGATHHAIEDIGLMRCLPGMTVIVPGTPQEASSVIRAGFYLNGPVYIRLGVFRNKGGFPALSSFKPGKGIILRHGRDMALVSTGAILDIVEGAADILSRKGWSIRVIHMPSIKPLDAALIKRAAKECDVVLIIEEHGEIGGLGSAMAEVLSEERDGAALYRISLPDFYIKEVGSRDYLLEIYRLTAKKIAAVARFYRNKKHG
jgi:transketolase